MRHFQKSYLKEEAYFSVRKIQAAVLFKFMQLIDKYPTDDYFKLFRKIEENIGVLMFGFEKTSLKDPKALRKNIHYTVLLPIFTQITRREKLNVKSLDVYEKKLVIAILSNSTTLFCLGALMMHSKLLSNILFKGFDGHGERMQLLNFANEAVLKARCRDTRVLTGVTSTDAALLRYISSELCNRHNLGVLFNYL